MTYKTYVGEPEGEIIYIDKIKNKNKKLISFNSNLDPEDTKVGATGYQCFLPPSQTNHVEIRTYF